MVPRGAPAVAITQLELERQGPGALGGWPGISQQTVSGWLPVAFLLGLGWASSEHGGLRAVELLTGSLGPQARVVSRPGRR